MKGLIRQFNDVWKIASTGELKENDTPQNKKLIQIHRRNHFRSNQFNLAYSS
jgi:hypothetical protein